MTVLRQADGIAAIQDGDVVYVARLPDGPITVLEGVAGIIWSQARDAERGSVAVRVAEATGQSLDTVRLDVDEFVDSLVRGGLLTDE